MPALSDIPLEIVVFSTVVVPPDWVKRPLILPFLIVALPPVFVTALDKVVPSVLNVPFD